MRFKSSSRGSLASVVASVVVLLTSTASFAGSVIFVDDDAPGGGDGASWNTAYRFLQDALTDASGGGITEVHVAQGIYKPDRDEANPGGTGSREARFQLVSGVGLFGGFAGIGAPDPDERDVVLYETILSGDLAGNDGPDFQGYDENSYSVVRGSALSEETRLDGFVIRGGNANGPVFEFRRGGGLRVDNDHIGLFVLADCVFTENRGDGAGGAYLRDVIASVSSCTFVGNESINDNAGGLEAISLELSMTDCVFANNFSPFRGGGMVLGSFEADVLIENCLFDSNVATNEGGGLKCFPPFLSTLHLSLRNCVFKENVVTSLGFGGSGGGIDVEVETIDLVDCLFVSNTAAGSGGGAYIDPDDDSTIVNCQFIGNEAVAGSGGGMYSLASNEDTIVNSTFIGNIAAGTGGGLANPVSGGGPGRQFVNSTFVGNVAGEVGGGIIATDADNMIDNCIFWDNSDVNGAGQDSQVAMGEPRYPINYSCVQGWDGTNPGVGTHGLDPLFIDIDGADDILGTDDDDARLQSGSPCNDAADNSAVPPDTLDLDGDGSFDEPIPFDLDGNPRFLDDPDAPDNGNGTPPIVDMGPYEFGEVIEPVEYVGPFGGSWFTPENWSNNAVPEADTDVVIPTLVIVDQPGAVVRDILILDGGSIDIQMGSLTARDITVASGGTIELTSATSALEVRGLNVQPGGSVVWVAGTIRVVGGVWNSSDGISVGCASAAALVLEENGTVVAPSFDICSQGTVQGNGTLSALVSNSGLMSPGTPSGVILIDGNYLQTAQGTLLIELAGYGTDEFDKLEVTAQVDLAGELTVLLAPEFLHEIGGLQSIMEGGQILGGFDNTTIPDLPGLAEFIFQADATSVSLFTMLTSTGPRLYVDDDLAGGDGQSWDAPIKNLQGALSVAEFFPGQVNEIWVAAGTYRPMKRLVANDPRSVTFQIIDGVSMFGGFAGDENSIEERDLETNVTTLSGDLAGNDGPGSENHEENAFRLLHAQSGNPFDNETWVDGFVVTATFQGEGGFISVANPNFRNCTFSENLQGVGLRLHASSIIEDCSFLDNGGRGLWIDEAFIDPLVQDCWFEGNGGGLYSAAVDGLTRRCMFLNNTPNASGGGASINSINGSVVECIFIGNTSGTDGGGVLFTTSTGMMVNCLVAGNVAERYGGGLALGGISAGVVANCVIFANTTVTRDGGGVSVQQASAPVMVNCTIANNTSGRFFGGIVSRSENATVGVDNSILWGNSDTVNEGESAQIGGFGTFEINYSCVEGWTGLYGGIANFGDDPMFVDPDGPDDILGTEDDDLHLLPGSPYIDAGDNTALPLDLLDLDNDGFTDLEPLPIDLDDAQRFFDDPDTGDTGNGEPPIVDRGPYEFGAPFGDSGEYVGPSGGSWFNPANWAGGELPDSQTDVIIADHVIIDSVGAVARNILIQEGGILEINVGSLTAQAMIIRAGGLLRLSDPSAVLELNSLDLQAGALLDWIAGTIRLIGATWTSANSIDVGCVGEAHLVLVNNAIVIAPAITICQNGEVSGDGTLITDVTNSGALMPGLSPGTLLINGDYLQSADGSMVIELAGYEPGTEYDVIGITGSATIDGTLTGSVPPGFEPLLKPAEFLTAASVSGQFSTVDLPAIDDGFQIMLHETGSTLSLYAVPPGPRVHVNANIKQAGGGTTWETATDGLDGALIVAELAAGDISEIWVAATTYVPSMLIDVKEARSITFQLVAGTAIYGGFVGGEKSLNERDFVNNVTILSGDVNGDDGPDFANNGENAYHIVTGSGVDGTAVLDGFTIRGGNANLNASFFTARGGALYNEGGSPTVRNNTFTSNRANAQGGAVFNGMGSNPTIENCSFFGNSGSAGGAIGNVSNSSPVVTNCEFDGNVGGLSGGAVANIDSSSPTISDSTFANNSSGEVGGAISNGFDCNPSIRGCLFDGNSSSIEGGAIFSQLGDPFLSGCTFVNNLIGIRGGAVYNEQNNATFVNCRFIGNVSESRGGAVYNDAGSDVTLIQCYFTGNYALRYGGAVFNNANLTTITNSTFSANVADFFDGGGVYNDGNAPAIVANCVLWGNTSNFGLVDEDAQIISDPGPGNTTVNYSCIQGLTGNLGGIGNIGDDPRFVDADGPDNAAGTLDDNLQLFFNSPCIDAASNVEVPADVADLDDDGDTSEPLPFDLAGNDRFVDDRLTADTGAGDPPVVDMGPYEFGPVCAGCPGPRLWIDPTGGSFNDPTNWHPDLPAETDSVIFDLSSSYTVTFSNDATSDSLVVTNGDVTLALNGNFYDLTNAAQETLHIGILPGPAASLTLDGGTLLAPSARVGGEPGSSGELRIDSAELIIADAVNIGERSSGSLVLSNGAVVNTGVGVIVHGQGEVSGDGTIVGNLTNFGIAAPGTGDHGVLAVNGDYQQLASGIGPVQNASTLRIDLGGSIPGVEFDVLEVNGEATLGGRLVVTADPGFEPQLGESFTIVTADSLIGEFDIAFLPPAIGDLILTIQYDNGGKGRPGSVTLVVEELDVDFFTFDDPLFFGDFLPPTDAMLLDVNNDSFLDVVLTIPALDKGGPNDPGSVVVFLNLGVKGNGQWNGFDPVPAETLVQEQPVSVSAGFFNDDEHVDLAVANIQFGRISVLLNNGIGDGSFTEHQVFDVDEGARSVAAGPLYGNSVDDLVVLTSVSSRQRFFGNNGNATFSLVQTVNGAGFDGHITTLDADGDGDPEVISAGTTGVNVTFRDDQSGLFGPGGDHYPVTEGTIDLRTADLDNSGFGDIMTINPTAGLVSVLVNLSDDTGAMAPPIDLQVGNAPSSLATVDLDADGDLDLVIVAENELGERVVRLKRNELIDGQLGFTDTSPLPVNGLARIVLAGDLNGDSRPDLIAINDETVMLAGGVMGSSMSVHVNATGALPCPADLDNSGDVGVKDLLFLLGTWGPCPKKGDCPADFDNSGDVGVKDLLFLLGAWGPCP